MNKFRGYICVGLMGVAAQLLGAGIATAGGAEGIAAYQRGDYELAAQELQGPAQQGDADAQYHLARLYRTGKGVNADAAAASSWFQRAAEQGHAGSQFSLGLRYAQGHGVSQDYVQAYLWFDRAAAQGHASAATLRDRLPTYMSPTELQAARAQQEPARRGDNLTQRTGATQGAKL